MLEIGDGYELGVTTGCIFIVMLNFIVAKLRSYINTGSNYFVVFARLHRIYWLLIV